MSIIVLLKSQVNSPAASPTYHNSLLADLKSQELSSQDCSVLLSSGDQSVSVHAAVLSNASKLLCDVMLNHYHCQSTANVTLILPASPPSTLSGFVSLLYTGGISNLSRYQARQVMALAQELGILISSSRTSSIIVNKVLDSNSSDCTNASFATDDVDDDMDSTSDISSKGLKATTLQVETIIRNKKTVENMKLCVPKSRLKRQDSVGKSYKQQVRWF